MDLTLKVKADGSDAVKQLKGVVNEINAAEAAAKREEKLAQQLNRWQQERAKHARDERRAKFETLSVEEKLVHLQERRARIAERLNRENLSATRREALMLAQARIGTQMRNIGPMPGPKYYDGAPPPVMAGGGGFWGAAAGTMTGALSGALARFGPAALLTMGGMGARRGARAIAQRASMASDEAATLGTDVVTAQLFKGAAQDSGGDFAELSSSFRTLLVSQGKAINGNKELIKSFERLGISAGQLRTMKPEELFLEIARKAEKAGESTAVWSDIMKTLGWRAHGLKAAFQNGFAGAVEALRASGSFIDEDAVHTLDQATDRLGAAAGVFAGVFAPAVATATEAISKMTAAVAALLAGLKMLNVFEGVGLADLKNPLALAAKLNSNAAVKLMQPGALAGAAGKVIGTYSALTKPGVKPNAATGGDAAEIARITEENEERRKQLEFDSLTRQEKINRLLADQVKLLEQIKRERDPLTKAQLESQELDVQAQLRGLRKPGEAVGLSLPATDAMSRIGFVRGGIDPTRMALAKQVTLLTRAVRQLEEMNRELKR